MGRAEKDRLLENILREVDNFPREVLVAAAKGDTHVWSREEPGNITNVACFFDDPKRDEGDLRVIASLSENTLISHTSPASGDTLIPNP